MGPGVTGNPGVNTYILRMEKSFRPGPLDQDREDRTDRDLENTGGVRPVWRVL